MSITVDLEAVQRIGFPVGGEPLVALDLADTLMTAVEPAVDLLGEQERGAAWWALQSTRLPESPTPVPAAVRRLRAAVRDLFDAHLEGRAPRPISVEDVNTTAASVPSTPRLSYVDRVAHVDVRWHTEYGGNPALAHIARETIDLFASPHRLARLRRCANPSCSMLFLAETSRRQWCASNVCGNRVRVARHQEKVRAAKHRQ
ncbi:CGNR zinc finger domain-containing protein [Kitasatospora sp. NPDC052896]|uniref:CGNR zinc finger domain-containing protein n=1 Tax=Kitasatospora sp. NPDC052896 TaxID=3364061 RepID=UPI0037C7BF0A